MTEWHLYYVCFPIPLGSGPQQPDSTSRSPSSGRQAAIGQPPPLINISDSPTSVNGKQHPNLSPHPRYTTQPTGHHLPVRPGSGGGSITQGIPASQHHMSNPVSRGAGSISMGTPRFNLQAVHHLAPLPPQQHQKTSSRGGTPPHTRSSTEGVGSITQGTPYDLHHGSMPSRSVAGGGTPSRDSEHQVPHSTSAGRNAKFEQMIKQMSPNTHPTSMASFPQPRPPHPPLPSTVGYNIPEMQSRATLAGDFITAQQMKDHDKPPHSQPHSPRSSIPDPSPRPPFPQGMIDPRQLGAAAAFVNAGSNLPYFLQYAAVNAPGAVGDPGVRRMSPVPPQSLHPIRPGSPSEQERDRMMMLQNAVDMRDKMPTHHQTQQQQQQWAPSQSGKPPMQVMVFIIQLSKR